ncbi:MAG: rod-binding protein [Litoreibacter sp.]
MITNVGISPPANVEDPDRKLRVLSTKLEATFLAEMLKTAGFGKSREGMGGGIGEEQFASFMIQNHAQNLAEAGGVGLSEHLFNALKGQVNED